MKFPKFKFFTILLTQFGLTTIVISVLFALSFIIQSETDAEEYIASKNQRVYNWLFSQDWAESFELESMKLSAQDVRGAIALTKLNTQETMSASDTLLIQPIRITTDQNFPTLTELRNHIKPIGRLFFGYYEGHYYILAKNDLAWLAMRSSYIDWLVFPDWLSLWPLTLLFIVIAISYLLLVYWLQPVKAALCYANEISRGNFDYRIQKHPNNELSELTHGLNSMAQDLGTLFDAKRGQLLAISHELKTPIARARLSLVQLTEDKIKSELHHDLEQMEAIINQLLEIEKLSLHTSISIRSYWLPTLIEEIVNEAEFVGRINVLSLIPESIAKLDRVRFQLLLRNLISNGLKYGDNKKVMLNITIADNLLCVKVSDQGQGIDSDDIDKVFEPFYRNEKSNKQHAHGTGLGLYLCQCIVQAHKGHLSVTSSIGQGSCFTITMPV